MASAFTMRVVGAALMLIAQILIARRLGVDSAGEVAAAVTVAALLGTVGKYGADQLIVRRIATSPDRRAARTHYRSAVRLIVPALSVLSLAMFALAPLLANGLGESSATAAFRWLALSVPFLGLASVQGEAIKGLGRSTAGVVTQSTIGPPVTIAVLLLCSGSPTVGAAAMALTVGYVSSSIAAHALWTWQTGDGDQLDEPDVAGFAREAAPFFWNALATLVLMYAPLLSLIAFGASDDVARFFAADRWTQIPSMMLVAVHSTVAPRFAKRWAARDEQGLRSLLRRSSAGVAAISAAVCFVTVVGGGPLLRLFGDGYADAAGSLRILAIGQFVVLACGPATSLLAMAGGERPLRNAAAAAAAMAVVGSVVLVPAWGLVGAATASSASLVLNRVLNLASLHTIRQRREKENAQRAVHASHGTGGGR